MRGMRPSEADARQYRGLALVPCYDPSRGIGIRGWWELRHKLSNDPLLFVRASTEEEAEEYGTKVAELAQWTHMRIVPEWTAPPHSYELIDFLRSTTEVFYQPSFDNLWSKYAEKEPASDDWTDEVPFGTTHRRNS